MFNNNDKGYNICCKGLMIAGAIAVGWMAKCIFCKAKKYCMHSEDINEPRESVELDEAVDFMDYYDNKDDEDIEKKVKEFNSRRLNSENEPNK